MPAPVGSNEMLVLHVSSDFAKQAVYDHLVASLDAAGVRQRVYVPVRSAEELVDRYGLRVPAVEYHFVHLLRPRHRFLFRSKIRRVVADVTSRVDLGDVSLVHAHFLYSDGAVALRIRERYGIPFVVAVRNTDLNVFMRLRPDLGGLCKRILRAAEAVIFISPAYLEQLAQKLPPGLAKKIRAKARVMPNGLSSFWLANANDAPASRMDGTLRLLYVGDFSRNKNIPNVMRAVASLRRHRDAVLTLVGDGGDAEAEIDSMLGSADFGFVRRLGRIEEPEALLDVYRAHDIFVMPSFKETFGVVYIEALSQGLPIIYSRGQGVDGYFESGGVGEAVNPDDPEDIREKIELLSTRLEGLRGRCVEEARRFDWSAIARSYRELYRSAARLEQR